MPGPTIPYPPSPAGVPDDLTEHPASYRSQQRLLLAGLVVFLLFYLGLIVLCVAVGVYCGMTFRQVPPLKVAGLVLSGVFFLYLVKGFFKRQPVDKTLHVEVTEDEEPVLFAFIHKLCEELDAPEPNRVYVSPDVNAAVMPRSSLVNLVVEPKKDLLIGLGLVNCLNLSEFKSVMAHEFGHFCQSGYTSSYSYAAYRIIFDLVEGEDWFDRGVDWLKRQENVASAVGHTVGAFLWVGRKVLGWLLSVITLQRLAVSREAEFHADLVAVKAGGSDAVVLSLMRLRFGNLCIGQAYRDLSLAADHKLFTRDLFFHQERAEPVVRRQKKDPALGVRPPAGDPWAGKDTRVFDPDAEELEHDEIPEMRRTHPPAHETEDNAKATFIPGVVDDRSPWVLFADPDALKERVTYKFYRLAMKIRKDTPLADPAAVQRFIDGEHADTTYDAKYQGVYDDRPLEPGDLLELNQLVRDSPWPAARIDAVIANLYDGAKGRAEEYDELRKEKAALENAPGDQTPRVKRKIKDIERQMDAAWEWYKSLDRKAYLVHVQMAALVTGGWREELVERYRFQAEVQRMYHEAKQHQEKAYAFATYLFNLPPDQTHPDFVGEVMQVLREARRALKKIVQDARDVNLPAMRNFEEGERLADFILPDKMVSELPLSYVKGKWVGKLLDQLDTVRGRCFRLHFKSVGGILALQERIAAKWREGREPVAGAIVGETVAADELPPDDVADDLPVEAEVVEAEVVEAEVVEAEVVEAVETPVAAGSAPPVEPSGFGVASVATGSVAAPRSVTVAARDGRPAVRITLVRPGEQSPLAGG